MVPPKPITPPRDSAIVIQPWSEGSETASVCILAQQSLFANHTFDFFSSVLLVGHTVSPTQHPGHTHTHTHTHTHEPRIASCVPAKWPIKTHPVEVHAVLRGVGSESNKCDDERAQGPDQSRVCLCNVKDRQGEHSAQSVRESRRQAHARSALQSMHTCIIAGCVNAYPEHWFPGELCHRELADLLSNVLQQA